MRINVSGVWICPRNDKVCGGAATLGAAGAFRSSPVPLHGIPIRGSRPVCRGGCLPRLHRATFVHVPYKSIGEALTEVIAGRVQFHVAPYISAVGLVREGRLRALAVTGKRRLPVLPDVPTAAESGLSAYEWMFWYGLLVSARTPASVVEQLHRELTGILKLPDVQKQLAAMGVDVVAGSSAEFGQLLEREVAKYARIARAANILPE